MLSLTSLSFAHPAVTAERRARLSIAGTDLAGAYRLIGSLGHEAFLLSTCLRVEIAWADGPECAPELLTGLYGDESLIQMGVVRTDEAAFSHLCRVAAGLESPLIGEPEVLGQFRQAAMLSQDSSAASGGLGRALEAAVGIGRVARRLMGEVPRGSLAALAADLAAPFARVAVFGAGAMARAAIEGLAGVDVTVFARRPGDVAGHPVRSWEEAPGALATYPVVIAAIPGKAPLWSGDLIASILASRREPLLLIDLGMPPAFSRPDAPSVRYTGVDELASMAWPGRVSTAADDDVTRAASTAWRRLTAPRRAGRVISGMVGQAEAVVAEEVQRFANRVREAEDPGPIVRQLAHTVARRVLHPPIAFISSADRDAEAVDLLAEAFGIDDD